jgi:CheY-like chemotaxis protein
VTAAPRRILVVDDNVDSASSLAALLSMTGNQTRMAHDGVEAVQAAEQFRPDLVLLDLGLPGLNGFEACRRIREQPWSRNTVMVALTGWGHEDYRRKSQAAGFDHHMVKPVDPAALMELLETASGKGAA